MSENNDDSTNQEIINPNLVKQCKTLIEKLNHIEEEITEEYTPKPHDKLPTEVDECKTLIEKLKLIEQMPLYTKDDVISVQHNSALENLIKSIKELDYINMNVFS